MRMHISIVSFFIGCRSGKPAPTRNCGAILLQKGLFCLICAIAGDYLRVLRRRLLLPQSLCGTVFSVRHLAEKKAARCCGVGRCRAVASRSVHPILRRQPKRASVRAARATLAENSHRHVNAKGFSPHLCTVTSVVGVMW